MMHLRSMSASTTARRKLSVHVGCAHPVPGPWRSKAGRCENTRRMRGIWVPRGRVGAGSCSRRPEAEAVEDRRIADDRRRTPTTGARAGTASPSGPRPARPPSTPACTRSRAPRVSPRRSHRRLGDAEPARDAGRNGLDWSCRALHRSCESDFAQTAARRHAERRPHRRVSSPATEGPSSYRAVGRRNRPSALGKVAEMETKPSMEPACRPHREGALSHA